MNANLVTGFLVILAVITFVYVYFAPHRESAMKRIVLMAMLGLVGFWQIFLLG